MIVTTAVPRDSIDVRRVSSLASSAWTKPSFPMDSVLPPRTARPEPNPQPAHNHHRPHRGIANAQPLQPLPEPITKPAAITRLRIRRIDRRGGLLHEYDHAA
jgi:hypothetical protein